MNYHLKIRTISPVSILTGTKLSPLSDFFIDNGKLHYIKQNEIAKELVENDALMDLYTSGIISGMDNNRSEFDLQNFIKTKLDLSLENASAIAVPTFGLGRDRKIELSAIVKNVGNPYIPGSSMKGAIKTALLYDFFKNSKDGQKVLEEILIKTSNKYEECKFTLDEIESFRRNRRKVPWNLKNDLKNDLRDFNIFLDSKINLFFGDIRAKRDSKLKKWVQDYSKVRIYDSNTFEGNYSVYKTERLSIKSGEKGIPVVKEGIDSNVEFDVEWQILPTIEHPDLQYLNDEKQAIPQLLKRLNDFALDYLEMETSLFADLLDKLEEKGVNARELKTYENYLNQQENLFDLIEENEKEKGYLSLGNGKTFWQNSIGLAIYKKDKEVFSKYVRLFQLGEPDQSVFPITRTITLGNNSDFKNQQMGWVEIELKE